MRRCYSVRLVQTVDAYTTIEVEAANLQEAKEKAIDIFESSDCDPARINWDTADEVEVVDARRIHPEAE